MPVTEAPFDSNGNMVSYPLQDWRENEFGRHERFSKPLVHVEPFYAEMRIVDIERGQSAARMVLQDTFTEKTYPLFLSDLLPMLQEPQDGLTEFRVRGTWAVSKRGQNYGIKRIEPSPATEWSTHMRSLLGKQVRVVLNPTDPAAIAVGKLLSFTTDGEVVVQDDGGIPHYCWPNLETVAIP
ncbi:hypothetical protein PBI_MRMAGOO_147 [Mycobacterium phage MrMagoo]|uniref:Uncharacterized protein n=1 Tax=Mycobacterium phage MrMagoo TaxID=1927020 RepID=A0A1L6BYR5_9CAUD|nr:hypothetical protein J4U04_gp133 [Mycobacterium phage MrMagoo]APQ42229.1 hypothetical protein PBI_MRMAGOO_147 [Mycobacterium phage MrMagoo]ARM70298.1 hypothetical protein SEA_GARDENSALSA_145 [Mycobacterium phage GardenSalsa]